MTKVSVLLLLFLFLFCFDAIWAKYEPNWDSLDTRPIPPWFDEAKIGIFIHWGVFSVPSICSEWFWADWKSGTKECSNFIKNNYPPDWTYQDFARDFKAEFFNATQWAEIFKKSGAQYVILTSKHHEGFTLWPSRYSFSWNAKDIGPHRDLVGELAKAVRMADLKFGLYHSLYEWYNPVYLADKENNFTTQNFVNNKILPELIELVNNYEPSYIWSDGDWEAYDSYWKATEFLAWLYNDSPVKEEVIVNDRWGIGIPCHHGDVYSCADRYDPGKLQKHKWENAMTLDKKSWGFRRNAQLEDYLTTTELFTQLARTISCGGNLLINVGPTKDGIISPIFEERLADLGIWLEINGEAIYESQPWSFQNDSLNGNVWYTSKNDAVYPIILEWPKLNVLILKDVVNIFRSVDIVITLLGNSGKLKWMRTKEHVEILLPDKASVQSRNAWVLKISTEAVIF